MCSHNEHNEVIDVETENEQNESLMEVVTQSMNEQRKKSLQDIEDCWNKNDEENWN